MRSSSIRLSRRQFFGAATLGVAGTAMAFPYKQRGSELERTLHVEGELPSLDGATGWLNAPPLNRRALRGKVVVVNFWTYTCINWRRTLPYLRIWAEKYERDGLVMIGAHTPEFDFEADVQNVRRAVQEMGIFYPVAIDNRYAIWNAFENQYWPALYFIDANGRIRHHHFGEGAFEESESVLQQLLREAGATATVASGDPTPVQGSGLEAAADWRNLQSPETYTGSERTENFVSAEHHGVYEVPRRLGLNQWALAGAWRVQSKQITSKAAGASIVYRFHARDVHMVMGPSSAHSPLRLRVSLDGKPPGSAKGSDIELDGSGSMAEPRLYQLIRQSGPVMDRTFAIEFPDPGASAYSFTFG